MKQEERPQFVIETERIYKSFEKDIELLRECEPSKQTDIKLRDIVVSAYLKAYDFVIYICSLSNYKHAFFQIPMLRSICEDLITLTYILREPTPKQNYIIVAKQYEELRKSSMAQRDFFNNYNAGQIVPPVINENSSIEEIIKAHKDAGHDFEKTTLPKVYQMTEQVNQKYLYDFIYHATSKVMHFDIFTLLSMGWGEIDKSEGTIRTNFSYQHDYKHYFTFGLFYSSYLFLNQTENFKAFLALPDSIELNLLELKDSYGKIDWPELITFRQLNIEPPSVLIKAMNRIINQKL